MAWYTWTTVTKFNTWHTRAKAALAIPRVGYNAETGEPEPDDQWTVAYTAAVTVATGDVRAFVDPEIAALVPSGLGVPCNPPPAPEDPS